MIIRSILRAGRPIRAATADIPGDILRFRVWDRERSKRRKRDSTQDEFFVPVPESAVWLDTAQMPMVLAAVAVAVALFAKVLMMVFPKRIQVYSDLQTQEWLERKIQKAPPEQGTVRMPTREEWDEIQEVRPRTPFESKLARPNARLRTGEPIHMEDVKDWTIDVLTYALTRAEESAKQR